MPRDRIAGPVPISHEGPLPFPDESDYPCDTLIDEPDTIMRRHGILLLFLAITFSGLTGCGGVGSIIERGDKAAARGDYWTAASAYLQALAKDADNEEALAGLTSVAEPAYRQKSDLIEGYKANDDLDHALEELESLRTYLVQLRRYVSPGFVPMDVDAEIASVSRGAAEQHYRRAEGLFEAGEYAAAIAEYERANSLVPGYGDATGMIAESHYRMAEDLVSDGSYRLAADAFLQADETVRGFRDSVRRAAHIFRELGLYFLDAGACRQAYEDLSQAAQLTGLAGGLGEEISSAETCAISNIAFGAFDNSTGRNLAGMDLGDFIYESVRTKTLDRGSRFLRMLDRDQLDLLIREQALGAQVIWGEAPVRLSLLGVDYMIFGKLNQVYETRPEPRMEEVSSSYTYVIEVPDRDRQGRRTTRRETGEGVAYFDRWTASRQIVLSGVIRVVEVSTSSVLINYQISERREDRVDYLTNPRAGRDLRGVTFPDDIERLLDARQELYSTDVLARDLIDKISDELVDRILDELDHGPTVADPGWLEL